MIKILFIEDDKTCAYTTQGGLELLDIYDVEVAHNGKEGLELFDRFQPDVLVTDIEMPEMDGYELVRQVRIKDKSVVIIMASGRTMPKDVLKGYELGVDDYIKKPFVAEELHAHIQAILKRMSSKYNKDVADAYDFLYIGNYKFNFREETLELRMQKQKLTTREADILKMLYENKNTIVAREKILIDLWESADFFSSRSLDVFIAKLRKHLAYDPSIQIVTIKGKGIILKTEGVSECK
jgi:DNA-binding response OmpR family regulator